MKRVLAVYFSQTGQLQRAVQSMCAPLEQVQDVSVDWLALEPQAPYPFPWPFFRFFDQFPETVHLKPPALRPFAPVPAPRYDLVILAYPVWFLSPAPPMTAFVTSDAGRALLRDTPVITLIACRNMWLMADRQMRGLLADAGARHCDHAALVDRSGALASFVTTPRWMLTGRKDAFWGFPPPGVPDEDVAASARFGHAIVDALSRGELDGRRAVLSGLQAVRVDDRLIASERIGRRSFEIWGRLVMAFGAPGATARRAVLAVYAAFLVAMIVTIVPLSMLLRALMRPLLAPRLARLRAELEQPSGSGSERMAQFASASAGGAR